MLTYHSGHSDDKEGCIVHSGLNATGVAQHLCGLQSQNLDGCTDIVAKK